MHHSRDHAADNGGAGYCGTESYGAGDHGRPVPHVPVRAAGLGGTYRLALYHHATNAGPLAARTLDDGVIGIGRDVATDWSIPDPSRTLSRLHCEVSCYAGALLLRSLGGNGVYDATTGARLPHGKAVRIVPPFAFKLGAFRIVVSEVGAEATVDPNDPTGFRRLVPTLDGPAADPLVAAFCEGAQIDSAMLAGVDAATILRRAGAMYRQALVGICDLTVERDRARASYRVGDRGIGNSIANPFEWTPTQRLAVDLLVAKSTDFLPGPAAIATSFDNIRRHLVATTAACDAALQAAVPAFPSAGSDPANGAVARAFVASYEACEQRMSG